MLDIMLGNNKDKTALQVAIIHDAKQCAEFLVELSDL